MASKVARIRMDVHGVDELAANLLKLETTDKRNAIRVGLWKSAPPLLDEMRRLAPVLKAGTRISKRSIATRPGELRDSLIRARSKRDAKRQWVRVGPRRIYKDAYSQLAGFFENGTFNPATGARFAKRPFMRAALDTRAEQVVSIALREIGRHIERMARA